MPQTFYSTNPSTLEKVGPFTAASPDEIKQAVEAARNAAPLWASLSIKERSQYLLKAREYILDHIDHLAQTISDDNGKPKVEAISSDILPICDLLAYFGKKSEKLLKDESVSLGLMACLGRRSKIVHTPLGVVAIITPWNFPFSIPMGAVAMALVAGNCVLLKSADATPRVGLEIEKLFKAIKIPEHVFTHFSGGAQSGEALVQSNIDKVFFTGSVKVGKRIMEICSQKLTPCSLELGGKDAMIVCEDAPLELASSAAVWGAFCNSGQICASVERVYVHEKIADAFIQKVVEKSKQLRQGIAQHDFNIDLGPLTTEAQLHVVEKQMQAAKEDGAQILLGGKRNPNLKGYFFEATVLSQVKQNASYIQNETFGPTLPILTFKTEDEALALANDSIYGLTASVWSKNISRARKLALKIKAGTVCVNECTYTHALAQTPWGGLKDSGFGRTHGKIGLHEMTQTVHLHENFIPLIKNFWWFKYDQKLYESFKYLAKNYSGNFLQKIKAVFKILTLLPKKRI